MPRLTWVVLALVACRHVPAEPVAAPDERLVVHGQKVPLTAVPTDAADFAPAPGTVVMHYYGSGGWGIQWRGTYVVAAPYFSNHSLAQLLASSAVSSTLTADAEALRAGTAGTPIADTRLMLIGHGHVDHAGDVQGLFDEGLIKTRPALMADRSTTNELAALTDRFSCVAAVDYFDPEAASTKCPVPNVRVTPFSNAHAPHLNLAGLDVAAYGGVVTEPRHEPPAHSGDFKLGITWGYLIDLLDDRGAVVFRIHYVDAVGTPPHGLVPKALLKERDVDVHIACVPGFEQADFYPDAVLSYHHVKYVLLGHWEDFFQPWSSPLRPLRNVLDPSSIDRFIDVVQRDLPRATTVAPLDACGKERTCGPRGETWALPVPGETFRFAVR